MQPAMSLAQLVDARHLTRGAAPFPLREPGWTFRAVEGRLVLVRPGNGAAPLSCAMRLLWDAQRQGQTAVWIAGPDSLFFPPDAEALGVDLAALPVVRMRDRAQMWKAADCLLRCDGFGLIAIDLASAPRDGATVPDRILYRLSSLARLHGTAVLLLAGQADEISSSAISLSVRPSVAIADSFSHPRAILTMSAVRDRLAAGPWSMEEPCVGPPGLY